MQSAMILLVQERMGSSCKSTDFPKNVRIRLAVFPDCLRPNMCTCKSMALTPVTEAAFLQNTLKSGKLASGLNLVELMTLTFKVTFPVHPKGNSMIPNYINQIKYASSKVCREGMIDKLFMDEMETWTFRGRCQTLKFSIRKVTREGEKSCENKKKIEENMSVQDKIGKIKRRKLLDRKGKKYQQRYSNDYSSWK